MLVHPDGVAPWPASATASSPDRARSLCEVAGSNHMHSSVANLLMIAVVIPTESCEHAEDSSHKSVHL